MTGVTAQTALFARPIAHRGLHDGDAGVPENSLAALGAAARGGYGVEIDLQPSREGEPVVFHDATLDRLTGRVGAVAETPVAALSALRLGGTAERIPLFTEALAAAAGAPLIVEIKSAPPGFDAIARFDARIAEIAAGYGGPVAVMSFDDARLAAAQTLAPSLVRGVVSERADGVAGRLARFGAGFASLHHSALAAAETLDLRRRGVTVITWTIRSQTEADRAFALCDQITFEGFRA